MSLYSPQNLHKLFWDLREMTNKPYFKFFIDITTKRIFMYEPCILYNLFCTTDMLTMNLGHKNSLLTF